MATIQNLRRIAITGGPCSGKSTLLEILKQKGFQVVPEAAREVIEQEKARDSDCLPWKNLQKFQNKLSQTQFELEEQYQNGLIFSDRSVIDGHAYSILDGIIIPGIIQTVSRNRYEQIFLLDLLPIYRSDSARTESPEKAREIQRQLLESYHQFDYNPIAVPFLTPEQRADLILNHLGGKKL